MSSGAIRRLCAIHGIPFDEVALTCPKGHHVEWFVLENTNGARSSKQYSTKEGDDRVRSASLSEEEMPEIKVPEVVSCGSVHEALKRGLYTDRDFVGLMTALVNDLASGSIKPAVATAITAAADRILQVAEMRIRHGGELSKTKRGWLLVSGEESS